MGSKAQLSIQQYTQSITNIKLPQDQAIRRIFKYFKGTATKNYNSKT